MKSFVAQIEIGGEGGGVFSPWKNNFTPVVLHGDLLGELVMYFFFVWTCSK